MQLESRINYSSRISSIHEAFLLPEQITGIADFDINDLKSDIQQEFTLPSNLRLGHLAERVVSELIRSSNKYDLLFENLQLIENKNTLGELDFILQNRDSKQITHLELAYKFYLLDPSISSLELHNWIGPNRNDSLVKKLDKLKTRQFPLLHHPMTAEILKPIDISKIEQALCFLVSFYLPIDFDQEINPIYQDAVKGYYIDIEAFKNRHHSSKSYYLPQRKEWGINPNNNQSWIKLEELESRIEQILADQKAVLIWEKDKTSVSENFVVWW